MKRIKRLILFVFLSLSYSPAWAGERNLRIGVDHFGGISLFHEDYELSKDETSLDFDLGFVSSNFKIGYVGRELKYELGILGSFGKQKQFAQEVDSGAWLIGGYGALNFELTYTVFGFIEGELCFYSGSNKDEDYDFDNDLIGGEIKGGFKVFLIDAVSLDIGLFFEYYEGELRLDDEESDISVELERTILGGGIICGLSVWM